MRTNSSIAGHPASFRVAVWLAALQQVVVLLAITLFGGEAFRFLIASPREMGEAFVIAICAFWLSATYLILRRGSVKRRSDTLFISVGFLPVLFLALFFVMIIHGTVR